MRDAYGCPPGIPPGAPGCIPPDNPASPLSGAGGGARYNPVIWANRWGAIAGNTDTGAVGTSADETSKRRARATALERCGPGCVVKITYYNQCVAAVWGGGRYGTAAGHTVEEAVEKAIGYCGKAECEPFYTDCSFAERIR